MQGRRVYDADEVDGYIGRLQGQLSELERELGSLRSQLGSAHELARGVEEAERLLGRALLRAQQAADDALADAHRRGAAVVSNAEHEADDLLARARLEADRVVHRARAEAQAVVDAARREVEWTTERYDRVLQEEVTASRQRIAQAFEQLQPDAGWAGPPAEGEVPLAGGGWQAGADGGVGALAGRGSQPGAEAGVGPHAGGGSQPTAASPVEPTARGSSAPVRARLDEAPGAPGVPSSPLSPLSGPAAGAGGDGWADDQGLHEPSWPDRGQLSAAPVKAAWTTADPAVVDIRDREPRTRLMPLGRIGRGRSVQADRELHSDARRTLEDDGDRFFAELRDALDEGSDVGPAAPRPGVVHARLAHDAPPTTSPMPPPSEATSWAPDPLELQWRGRYAVPGEVVAEGPCEPWPPRGEIGQPAAAPPLARPDQAHRHAPRARMRRLFRRRIDGPSVS